MEALLVDYRVHKRLKSSLQVELLTGRYRFTELSQLESCGEAYGWKKEGTRLFFVIWKDKQLTTAREIVFYRRSCNTLAGLVLSDSKYLDFLKTALTFAEMFELENGFRLTEVETGDNVA